MTHFSLARIIGWLSLSDYTAAKEKATEEVIARYSRGNVAMQNGSFLDKDKLAGLSEKGDKAVERLRKLIPSDSRR
jgi:hypothetical protein